MRPERPRGIVACMQHFRIAGLDPGRFSHLYGRSEAELAEQHVYRYRVDASPGFPDRIEMRDLEPGESALLVNYTHLDQPLPYRSSHAVFVREGATKPYDAIDEIPQVLRRRILSVRAFDDAAMMLDGDVIDGAALPDQVQALLSDSRVDFIDVHFARRGCFGARICCV